MLMREAPAMTSLIRPKYKSIVKTIIEDRPICISWISRMEPPTIEFVGAPCGQHGPYTFHKAFKFSMDGKYRILSLGEFFFVKISENAPVAIGELQLLWEDKNNESVYMTSVRLYFLPEHTPEGRQEYHGEDEILAESDKIVLRADDLIQWIIGNVEWPIGSKAVCDSEITEEPVHSDLTKLFQTNNSGLELTDVKKEKQLIAENGAVLHPNVTILSYSRYCRYRTIMKRLEAVSNSWLKNALVSAIGGFTSPVIGTRVVFCRDTFDHPDLATHDFRQDHLAPNLKGRPRKKKFKAKKDESDSNDSDFNPGRDDKFIIKPLDPADHKVRRKVLRPNKDKITVDEQRFVADLMLFMKRRKTPIDRIPSLGFKQIDLYYFYNYAQKLGGYEQITQRRMWKHLYDRLGGNPGSTSAATCTRRHYERLLLSFERFQKGEKDLTPPPEDLAGDDDEDEDDDVDEEEEEEEEEDSNDHPVDEDEKAYSPPEIKKVELNHRMKSSVTKPTPLPILPKTVLAEQSPNHIKSVSIEATPAEAKRPDSKENGVAKPPAPVPNARVSTTGIVTMQGEPNMVMVVSKNGEMTRANRSGPSIMTPMSKHRPLQPTHKVGVPQPNTVPITQPTQKVVTPQQHTVPTMQFVQQPSKHPQLIVQAPVYPAQNNMVQRHGLQPAVYQHQKSTTAPLPHTTHQNNHLPSQHSAKVSGRVPSVTNANGPLRYVDSVSQIHRAATHSANKNTPPITSVSDPRRPSVIHIHHTQGKPEVSNPPPSLHSQTMYGPPHLRPGSQPPTAGIKRPYPFQSTSLHSSGTPPSAHTLQQNPCVYFRDLDPYANHTKWPHLPTRMNSALSPRAAHGAKPQDLNHLQNPTTATTPPDDQPMDFSMKPHKNSTHNSQSSTYPHPQQNHSQPLPAEEGPLNLVVHKRSREVIHQHRPNHQHQQHHQHHQQHQQPHQLLQATPAVAAHRDYTKMRHHPSSVNNSHHSHMALPYDTKNKPKVPVTAHSSSTLRTASPRTIADAHRMAVPAHHSVSPRLASHRVSPLPVHRSHSPMHRSHSQKALATTSHTGSHSSSSSVDRYRSTTTLQGATPVTASPDFGAAIIHPAFPTQHMMPGLLPPNIRPHVFYEAQLRATHTGPTPTTDSTGLQQRVSHIHSQHRGTHQAHTTHIPYTAHIAHTTTSATESNSLAQRHRSHTAPPHNPPPIDPHRK